MKGGDIPFWIEYVGENQDFRWRTKAQANYDLTQFTKDSFKLLNGNGKVIARCIDGHLTVEPGYKWDGCTGIGALTETGPTLIASIPHDILYIAKKCEPSLKYTLNQADIYFNRLMKTLYSDRGVSSVRPTLYYYGIKLLGWPFKFNKVPGYSVVKGK